MAWYQARRAFLDITNGHEVVAGTYIDTECVKWVAGLGPTLRKLDPNELPKPGIPQRKVLTSVEDEVEESVAAEPVAESIEEVVEESVKPVREALTKVKEVKPPVPKRKVTNTEEASDD